VKLTAKTIAVARRIDQVPGLATGVSLLVLGALMIPWDPQLEEVWDHIHELADLEPLAALLTRTGSPLSNLLLMGLILALAPRLRRAKVVWASVVAAMATTAVIEVLKHVVGRGRPCSVAEINAFLPFSPEGGWHSFPSGHAGNVAVVAIFAAFAFPRWRKLSLAWAVAVCLARVTLDRHYFGDILAGWGVGIALSGIVLWRFGLLASGDHSLLGSGAKWSRALAFGAAGLLLFALPGEHTHAVGGAVLVFAALLRAWTAGHHRQARPEPYPRALAAGAPRRVSRWSGVLGIAGTHDLPQGSSLARFR